jgi:hypothetical protein
MKKVEFEQLQNLIFKYGLYEVLTKSMEVCFTEAAWLNELGKTAEAVQWHHKAEALQNILHNGHRDLH